MSNARGLAVTLLVAGAAFWLAFDGGAYSLESRTATAIVVWSGLLTALALGLRPAGGVPRAAALAGASLALLVLFTGLSLLWAPSMERVLVELDRTTLFLGFFLVAILLARRSTARCWADGLALGLTATAVLAALSRFFPGSFPEAQPPEFLSRLLTRLSYPLDYWNGLAILVALAVPLLLRAATSGARPVARGLALAPLPALAATIYLTSSRGGFLTAAVGIVAFLVLTTRRWSAAAALALAAPGIAAVVLALVARPELANDPETAEAVSQGRSAGLIVLGACLATGALHWAVLRFAPTFAPSRRIGHAATALVLAGAAAGIAVADPVQRFERFKDPTTEATRSEDFVRAHLFSGGGSGRWQFWGTAVDEWTASPVLGHGPGTYEAWWAEHGTLRAFVRDAHSLYLETLAELGVVGFVLLAGALLTGAAAGVRRALRGPPGERPVRAALVAAFLAYLVAAGIDWMWELTVVSVVGFVLLGIVTGPATADAARRAALPARVRRARPAFAAGAALLGVAVLVAQAIPLLSHLGVERSQAAVARGDEDTALAAARAARDLQPWAATPRIQLALVHQEAGRLEQAAAEMLGAAERDPENWRPWLLRAGILAELGAREAARRDFELARSLNPRSGIWERLEP